MFETTFKRTRQISSLPVESTCLDLLHMSICHHVRLPVGAKGNTRSRLNPGSASFTSKKADWLCHTLTSWKQFRFKFLENRAKSLRNPAALQGYIRQNLRNYLKRRWTNCPQRFVSNSSRAWTGRGDGGNSIGLACDTGWPLCVAPRSHWSAVANSNYR